MASPKSKTVALANHRRAEPSEGGGVTGAPVRVNTHTSCSRGASEASGSARRWSSKKHRCGAVARRCCRALRRIRHGETRMDNVTRQAMNNYWKFAILKVMPLAFSATSGINA